MPNLPDIVEWWHSLPAEWQFLFAVPFAVAAAGFVREWIDSRAKAQDEERVDCLAREPSDASGR
jgi:hypothetical protein